MDAIDPRIDYLKIDQMILNGDGAGVLNYCTELKCDICEILPIWFDASSPDGLVLTHDNCGCYFYQFHVATNRDVDYVYYKNKPIQTAGQMRISISALSCVYFNITRVLGNKARIFSKYHEGIGFITQTNMEMDYDKPHIIVDMELDWWRDKSIY